MAVPGLPMGCQFTQRRLRRPDPPGRRVCQPVLVVAEFQRRVANGVEHVVAAVVQRDEIGFQLIGHRDPLLLSGTAGKIIARIVGIRLHLWSRQTAHFSSARTKGRGPTERNIELFNPADIFAG